MEDNVTTNSNETNETQEAPKKSSKGILALRWAIFIIFVLIFASIIGRNISKAFYTRHIVIEVTDKAVKNDKYMVYGRTITDDHLPKSYEITDSMLARRYDSSDLYAEIEKGKIYEMIVGGNRVPFMSWYPNIYEVKEIKLIDDSNHKKVVEETESEDFG